MRKLLKNILIFIVPLFLVLIALPTDRRDRYCGLENDCFNHGIWIYDRVVHNPNPVDIAFLGSSRTFNTIDDEYIQSYLQTKHVVNLGYCRFGRNLEKLFLDLLVENKKPEYIILEVRQSDHRSNHPVFPYVASSKEFLARSRSLDYKFISDVWKHLSYKVQLLQERIYRTGCHSNTYKAEFGFSPVKGNADAKELQMAKQNRIQDLEKKKGFINRIKQKRSTRIISEMNKICGDFNCKLIFLYLPGFGLEDVPPVNLEFYEQHGTVLIPPVELFADEKMWFDTGHLNYEGSIILTQFLAETLQEVIEE